MLSSGIAVAVPVAVVTKCNAISDAGPHPLCSARLCSAVRIRHVPSIFALYLIFASWLGYNTQ